VVLPLVVVMIGFAQQRVSEKLIASILDGFLFDVLLQRFLFDVLRQRFLFDVLPQRFLFDVPARAHRIRGFGAVHRQQRLIEVAHRVGVLVVFG